MSMGIPSMVNKMYGGLNEKDLRFEIALKITQRNSTAALRLASYGISTRSVRLQPESAHAKLM